MFYTGSARINVFARELGVGAVVGKVVGCDGRMEGSEFIWDLKFLRIALESSIFFVSIGLQVTE